MYSLSLARRLSRISGVINHLLSVENHAELGIQQLHERVNAHQGSRYTTYVDINPSLSVHDAYVRRRDTVPEHTRIAFSTPACGSALIASKSRLGDGPEAVSKPSVRIACVHVVLCKTNAT